MKIFLALNLIEIYKFENKNGEYKDCIKMHPYAIEYDYIRHHNIQLFIWQSSSKKTFQPVKLFFLLLCISFLHVHFRYSQHIPKQERKETRKPNLENMDPFFWIEIYSCFATHSHNLHSNYSICYWLGNFRNHQK